MSRCSQSHGARSEGSGVSSNARICTYPNPAIQELAEVVCMLLLHPMARCGSCKGIRMTVISHTAGFMEIHGVPQGQRAHRTGSAAKRLDGCGYGLGVSRTQRASSHGVMAQVMGAHAVREQTTLCHCAARPGCALVSADGHQEVRFWANVGFQGWSRAQELRAHHAWRSKADPWA